MFIVMFVNVENLNTSSIISLLKGWRDGSVGRPLPPELEDWSSDPDDLCKRGMGMVSSYNSNLERWRPDI